MSYLRRVLLAALVALALPTSVEAQGMLDRARRAVQDIKNDVDAMADDLAITRQNLDELADVPCESVGVACPEMVKASPTFSPEVYPSLAVIAVDESGGLRQPGTLPALLDFAEGEVLFKGYSTVGVQNLDQVQGLLSAGDGVPDADRMEEISEFVQGVPGLFVVSVTSSSMKVCRPSNPNRGTRYWEPSVRMSARLISMDVGEVVWVAQQTSSTCHAGDRDEALMAVLEDGATSLVGSLPSLIEP